MLAMVEVKEELAMLAMVGVIMPLGPEESEENALIEEVWVEDVENKDIEGDVKGEGVEKSGPTLKLLDPRLDAKLNLGGNLDPPPETTFVALSKISSDLGSNSGNFSLKFL